MKLTLITTTLLAGMALLQAAEAVPFTYGVGGSNEKIWNSKPITPAKPVKMTLNPKEKWGLGINVALSKTEPKTMYRIRFDVKGATSVYFKEYVHYNGQIVNTLACGKGPITVFGMTEDAKKQGKWVFQFEKNFKNLEVKELTVEKIKPEEYYKNLIPGEGLEPGYWYGIWGSRNICSVKLVKDDSSPAGKYLHFDATKPGDGNNGTMPLPYLADKKYEISFWIRSKTPEMIMWQLTYGGIGGTRLALKKEWTEVKMTGVTPKKENKAGMWLMFFPPWGSSKKTLPEFEIGGVDFHYVK